MSKRHFSMQEYWNRLAEENPPSLRFQGSTLAEWKVWHEQALRQLQALLGKLPQCVPLNAQVEYSAEEKDFTRQRVVFDVDAYLSIPCQVLIPKGMKPDGSNPAILCSHGHGSFGKDPVAGLVSTPAHQADIDLMNYDYAAQMARAGFLTLTPDLRGFGERRDGADPFPGRDACNVNYLKGSLMGYYPLALNIWDMCRCVDYLQSRPEVDPQRIGMMGLSQGGTMTTFTAALEPRIKAADIIGYVNPFAAFGIDRANFCGSQILPNLYQYLDAPDVAGLIAPRPLLIEMGTADSCFFFQDLWQGYEQVRRIYGAADAADALVADVHAGAHAFAGNLAFSFFRKHL